MSQDYQGRSFEELRREALEEAPDRGISILNNSATNTAFASDTSEFGLNYREDLQKAAEDRVESHAARFVDYEATEKARRAGVYTMMSEDGPELSTDHGVGEANLEDLYRAFILIDRLQRGYTDKRPEKEFNGVNRIDPERYPNPLKPDSMLEDQIAATEESGTTDPDNIGTLNQNGVFVINDDWISYRNGEHPPGVDEEIREEVYDFLDELGVAR